MPRKKQKSEIAETTLHDRIEIERRRLQKASAILECLAVTLDAGLDIEYSDVASVVRDLINQATNNLDSVKLKGGKAG